MALIVHRDLKPESLTIIANLIASVWAKARKSQNEAEGDGPWGLGCRFYERMCYALRKASLEHPWLRLIEKRMHFVFTVGAVPVRFYRGRSRRAKAGYLFRRSSEMRQQQLAFGVVTELDWVCRIAIEAQYDQSLSR